MNKINKLLLSFALGILITCIIAILLYWLILLLTSMPMVICFTLGGLFFTCLIARCIYEELSERKTNKPDFEDAVHVIICGKSLWLDLHNLKNDEVAICDKNTKAYGSSMNEHHFDHHSISFAVKDSGKRGLTELELSYISTRPSYWDDLNKGRWFSLDLVGGATTDVFFPAAGLRNVKDGALIAEGKHGYYMAIDYTASKLMTVLDFNSESINRYNKLPKTTGCSIRCVRE